MHETIRSLLQACTVITIALSAGLLFAYSVSVNPGLGQLPDAGYLSAMQCINRAIQNPVFFCVFFGPLILLPLNLWVTGASGHKTAFAILAAATAIYAIGVLGVTIFGNVPLNNALDAFQLKTATAVEMRYQRLLFEAPWNRFHAIRTVSALLSLVMILAIIIRYPLRQ